MFVVFFFFFLQLPLRLCLTTEATYLSYLNLVCAFTSYIFLHVYTS